VWCGGLVAGALAERATRHLRAIRRRAAFHLFRVNQTAPIHFQDERRERLFQPRDQHRCGAEGERAGAEIAAPRHPAHFRTAHHPISPRRTRLQFNDITPAIQSHLARVYGALAMTMAAAVAGCALGSWLSRDLTMLGVIGTFGTLLWLELQSDKQNTAKRLAILAAHGVCQGLALSSFVAMLHYVDPTIVPLALLATAVIFVCFSGFALFSKRRSMLYLGGTLSSVLLFLAIGGLANSLLFRSSAFASLELYVGLAMFIGAWAGREGRGGYAVARAGRRQHSCEAT